MKLYSRRQLVFFSLLSAMIVMLFALGIGLLKFPGSKSETALKQEQASLGNPSSGAQKSGVD